MLVVNKKVLGLLGLASRARKISLGADGTEQAIEKNKTKLVIVAEDASDRTKRKFTNKCNQYDIPIIIYGKIDEISNAIGKKNKAVLGLEDNNLAKEIDKIIRGDMDG